MQDDSYDNMRQSAKITGTLPPQSLQPDDQPLARLSRTTVEPHYDDDDEHEIPAVGEQKTVTTGGTHTTVFSCPVDHSGTSVYLKGWLTDDCEFPPLVFVHDLGEHIGKYRKMAIDLNADRCNFYGFDLRGHGRSGRMLGHITRFDDLVKDLLQVVAWVKHKEKGRQPILVGQGIGALVIVHFLATHKNLVQGAAIAAPSFTLSHKVRGWKRMLIRTLSEIIPTLRMPTGLKPRLSTAHLGPAGKTTILENLVPARAPSTPPLTAAFINETLNAMELGLKKMNDIQIPTLVLYPSHDPICDYAALRAQSAKAPKHKQELVEIESSEHRLFLEDSPGMNPKVREVLWPWLQAFRLTKK